MMTDPIRTDGAGGLSAAMARFAARTPAAALPAAARHQVRMSMLDWCAVGLAGCEENVSRIVRDMLAEDGGAARSTVLGLRARLPARAAALANGTTAHALDYDDT